MYKIILVLLISLPSFAHFDLSAGGSLRSYPSIGGQFEAELGYNQLLWGSGKSNGPLYGLLRPYLKLNSSGVINGYETAIELYPISILGIVVGKEKVISKFDDFPFYECEQVHCEGTIDRDFIRYRAALGFKSIVATGEINFYENEYDKDNSRQFAEFRFVTLANSPQEDLYVSRYVLGYKLDKDLIALATEYSKLSNSRQTSKMDIIAYIKNKEHSSMTFGVGAMKTTHEESGFIAVFQYRFNFSKSEKLF